MNSRSIDGILTKTVVPVPFIAWIIGMRVCSQFMPCSMLIRTKSNPERARTSARNGLPSRMLAPKVASPFRHRFLSSAAGIGFLSVRGTGL
jgi:hypothetical protein